MYLNDLKQGNIDIISPDSCTQCSTAQSEIECSINNDYLYGPRLETR